jgi:transcription elongation factor GreA
MTPEGYRKLQEELKRMRSEDRPRIIQAIEEARAHGDLSENAEYDAAKNAQGQLDARMKEIEDHLGRAQVIDPASLSGDRVVFGATVVLMDLTRDTQLTYQLVGEDESDLSQGKISIKAPLGRALIGKSKGDFFVFKSPAGERELEVEDIRFE